MYNSTTSFRDTAMKRQPGLLTTTYNSFASEPDLRGDADAHALHLDPAKTLTQNLTGYYTAKADGVRTRWKSFGAAIGLGTFASGGFPGNTAAWRSAMQGEVMNAALAYAAANGHRDDVVNVVSDPGPGVFAPTIWESYWNISGWVLDEFLLRVTAGATAEP